MPRPYSFWTAADAADLEEFLRSGTGRRFLRVLRSDEPSSDYRKDTPSDYTLGQLKEHQRIRILLDQLTDKEQNE